MGAYLSKPVTDKEYENGEDNFLSFVSCSMQGWRTSQEDSHNCIIDYNDHMSLFAVYDGHGGAEVAQLCSDKLPNVIKSSQKFIDGNYTESLIESFLSFDESILTSEVQDTLKKLSNIEDNKSDADDDEEDDPNLLQEEATLPLSQLLRKYQLSMMDNESEEEVIKQLNEQNNQHVEESTTSNVINSKADVDQIKKFQENVDENIDDEEDEEFVMGEDEEEEDDEEDDEDEDADTEENEDGSGEENGNEGMAKSLQDFQYMHSSPGFDSGSTAVVAIVDKKEMKIYVANAGDSRCVLCRNGHALDLSLDHKPEDEIESLRITRAGGVLSEDGRVNGGLNLSRSIGDHSYKRNKEIELKDQMISALPDIKTISIQPQDDEFLVLACDGIWNTFSSEDLVEFIKKRMSSMDLKDLISEIFAHCLAPNTSGDGTGCDNMTCIIVKLKASFHNNATLCNGSTTKRKAGDDELQEPPAKIIKTSHN